MAFHKPGPLVLVEGFLSTTSAVFWGKFEQFLNSRPDSAASSNRPIFFTSVGPVSSLHDRACELYYELKGGRVDYGEAHATDFRHERFGRNHYQGLYPVWSVDNPLHFLGHSMGGPTVAKLIALLREGFFGEEAHPDMVLSVTSVSAPFRGTQLVYTLGEKVDSAPSVRFFSVGAFISRIIHMIAYISPLLPPLPFDLHEDARLLTCHQSSFSAFLRQLWISDWAEGRDAAPYDCTFGAADEREASGEGAPNPGTWYRSYTGTLTRSAGGAHHVPLLSSLFSPFCLSALLAGFFDFSVLRPLPSWFPRDLPNAVDKGRSRGDGSTLGEEYWANDGIVPLFSQWHPLPCSAKHCTHLSIDQCLKSPRPGIWHVNHIPGAVHHVSVVPVWLSTQRQREFWTDVGKWLELVEEGWRELREP